MRNLDLAEVENVKGGAIINPVTVGVGGGAFWGGYYYVATTPSPTVTGALGAMAGGALAGYSTTLSGLALPFYGSGLGGLVVAATTHGFASGSGKTGEKPTEVR